jgi:hypothetical protein
VKERNLLKVKRVSVVVILSLLILSPVFWKYRRTIKRVILNEIYSLRNRNNKALTPKIK